jgi:hypothetical protein
MVILAKHIVIVAIGHCNNKIEKPQDFVIVIMIVYVVKEQQYQMNAIYN